MRLLTLLLFVFATFSVQAQITFTEKLKEHKSGEGKVIVIQDAEIERAVNTNKPIPPKEQKKTETKRKNETPAGQKEPRPDKLDTAETYTPGATRRVRAMGYRIQVFTGSNSHQDKLKAQAISEKCKKAFPMLSAYPRFISPRWICRVGDFKTREDAQEYANKIRAARIATEVHIVRCEVTLRVRE